MSKTARGTIKNYIISLAPHEEAMPSISSLYYYLLLCHSQLSTISVLFLRWKTTTIHGKHPCLFLMPSTAFLFWVIIRQRLMLCKQIQLKTVSLSIQEQISWLQTYSQKDYLQKPFRDILKVWVLKIVPSYHLSALYHVLVLDIY